MHSRHTIEPIMGMVKYEIFINLESCLGDKYNTEEQKFLKIQSTQVHWKERHV